MFDTSLPGTDHNIRYDFPVIFLPRAASTRAVATPTIKYQTFEQSQHSQAEAQSWLEKKASRFVSLKLSLMPDQNNSHESLRLTEIDVDLKAFEIYLEDYFIYNLVKVGIEFVSLVHDDDNDRPQQLSGDLLFYDSVSKDLNILFEPQVMLRRIRFGQLDALITLQTSLKIYLATYKMPVNFDELNIAGLPWTIMSSPQLVKILTSHYLTSLLFKAGWLLGSLDLIGSPTAFVQQVSNGVYDFLQMPYRGLRSNGASGLMSGLSNGSLSLIRNLSAGSITSLTTFSSFISRNMDILSFDPHHMSRKEEIRHQPPDSFGSGLLQVSSGFIISIIGAIGGLAEQPLQSMHNSDSLIKGVSKGLLGLVTKPVGAVAELVNQTGQGLLRFTGVNRVPTNELRLQRRALNKEFSRFSISMTKCLWKFIQTNDLTMTVKLNAFIEAVYTVEEQSETDVTKRGTENSQYNLTGCYLIMTEDVLYIIDKNDDMLLRAFYLAQVDLSIQNTGKCDLEARQKIFLNN